MFSANQTEHGLRKDSVNNAEQTGVFCWQMATYDLREAVNASSAPVTADIDEFEVAHLEKTDSHLVRTKDPTKARGGGSAVPMVKASPVKLECEYHTTLRLPADPPMGTVDVVIGKVVGVHIDEAVLTDGMVDLLKARPIARCGYNQYTVVNELFDMVMPGGKKVNLGLEGAAGANE